MTASVAMTNYFNSLREREDFGSFEIVMDNPRTFCCAPPRPEDSTKSTTSPKEAKREKRWSQSLDLSDAAIVSICGDAPFIPQRRLSLDASIRIDEEEKEQQEDHEQECKERKERASSSSLSPVRRPGTPRMTRRKGHNLNKSVPTL
ncbi:unnamed protein product [Cylindrotheca closterium]|uniref:Uncharacterized protein n=1 Tax=Cylindrotheca closterium TaxID=2856 RepID=A0AAD2JGH9_9STRA|nr:unnamed protein product [Cylindrotheca closterium]